jgi:hypothetical protein
MPVVAAAKTVAYTKPPLSLNARIQAWLRDQAATRKPTHIRNGLALLVEADILQLSRENPALTLEHTKLKAVLKTIRPPTPLSPIVSTPSSPLSCPFTDIWNDAKNNI